MGVGMDDGGVAALLAHLICALGWSACHSRVRGSRSEQTYIAYVTVPKACMYVQKLCMEPWTGGSSDFLLVGASEVLLRALARGGLAERHGRARYHSPAAVPEYPPSVACITSGSAEKSFSLSERLRLKSHIHTHTKPKLTTPRKTLQRPSSCFAAACSVPSLPPPSHACLSFHHPRPYLPSPSPPHPPFNHPHRTPASLPRSLLPPPSSLLPPSIPPAFRLVSRLLHLKGFGPASSLSSLVVRRAESANQIPHILHARDQPGQPE